jgi:hypothetical protein
MADSGNQHPARTIGSMKHKMGTPPRTVLEINLSTPSRDRDKKRTKGGHSMDEIEETPQTPEGLRQMAPPKSALKESSVGRKQAPEEVQVYTFDIDTNVTPKAKSKFSSNYKMEPLNPTETDPSQTIRAKFQETYSILTTVRPDLNTPAEDWNMMEIF